ncbi:hypothetical protein ZIOFF_008822 [Zingiber officinale]|uniref:Uncharacterized protein n=1 Tax=Zingiber officinale TaxID=94328 RepID=A0A8J5LU12_ZINOF|nr:hypothetical protein ZIOFF_008822 [Zingiber officinale]
MFFPPLPSRETGSCCLCLVRYRPRSRHYSSSTSPTTATLGRRDCLLSALPLLSQADATVEGRDPPRSSLTGSSSLYCWACRRGRGGVLSPLIESTLPGSSTLSCCLPPPTPPLPLSFTRLTGDASDRRLLSLIHVDGQRGEQQPPPSPRDRCCRHHRPKKRLLLGPSPQLPERSVGDDRLWALSSFLRADATTPSSLSPLSLARGAALLPRTTMLSPSTSSATSSGRRRVQRPLPTLLLAIATLRCHLQRQSFTVLDLRLSKLVLIWLLLLLTQRQRRDEFLEAVSGTMDAHLRYFKQGYELLHQMEPYIHQVDL